MTKQEKLYHRVFREDGTLRGFTLTHVKPQRGGRYVRIQISFEMTGPKPKILRLAVNNDFTNRFVEAVDFAAQYHGVSKKSRLYRQMLDSMEAHLYRYNFKLKVEVITLQMQSLYRGNECYDTTMIPHPKRKHVSK